MTAATPLPCPFCGGTAIKISYAEDINHVCCIDDKCLISPHSTGNTKAAAIARWNTRAPIPTAPQEPPTDAMMRDAAVIARRLIDGLGEDSK